MMNTQLQKPSSTILRAARATLNVTLVILLVWYLWSHWDELAELSTIRWQTVGLLVLVVLLGRFVAALQTAYIFRSIGSPIGIFESFALSSITGAVELFVPQATTVVKAVYLKQRYAVPYAKTPAIFVGRLVIFLGVGAILLIISNLVVLWSGASVPTPMWVLAIGAIAATTILTLDLPTGLFPQTGRVGRWLNLMAEGWHSLRTNRRLLFQASTLQFLEMIIGGIAVAITYSSLGAPISPWTGVSMVVFAAFSDIITLTPGNLGIKEAVYGYLTMVSGFSFATGVAGAALLRAIGLLVTLVAAPISWYFLIVRGGVITDETPPIETG
jgi:uncharacterized membrane protein YbhN (UPF0104 family)